MYVCVIPIIVCKQKTAYEMRISDWSSDVCSSDLLPQPVAAGRSRSRRASRLECAPLVGGPDQRGTSLSPDTGGLQGMLAAATDRDRSAGNPVAARFPLFFLRISRLAAARGRHRQIGRAHV